MASEPAPNPVLTVLARLPITTVLSDLSTGAIVWASTPDPGMVGLKQAGDIVGRNLLDFIDPSQHEIALRDLQAVAEGQSPPPVTYHLRRVGGGTTDAQIASIPTTFDGRPTMLSLVTDISTCTRALRDLEETQDRYRQLVETSTDGIVVVSSTEGILYANETFWRAVGAASADEVVGQPPYRFVRDDLHNTVREIRRRVLRYGTPNPPTPLVIVRLDGTTFEATAQTMRVLWSGEPVTQTRLRDLTPPGA